MRWLGPPFALLALAALAMPGAAEPDAASPRGDLRLERRITRVIDGRPLAEVIPSIGKELGVALSATMSAADHRVVLCVRDRPAGQLLEELAEHLELEWRRSDTGYALTEAPAVRRKHEEARKARASAEWREARTWVGRAARLASLPAAQLLSTERELSDRLNSADLPPAERAQVADELALVQEARRPATPLAVSILQSLTAAQVARLQSGGDLLLGDGELTPALLAQVRAVRNPETPFADATEFPVWADVLIQFRDWNGQEGPPRPGDRSRQLSITLVGRREREGKQEWTPLGWQPKLPDPASARPLATQTDDPALLRVVELKVPERKRPTLERLGGVETAATWESRLWPAWPTLGDVARQLSEVSGLEVMADGFVRSRVDPRWLEGRRSVAAILDRVATGLDYDWSKQGNLIRLHSRQRVQDRDRDAPERILQPWRERVAHREVASLDDLAELAARLTDEQARGVSDYWGWYFDQHWVSPPTGGAIMFYAQRRHLRFWAALSSAQRQAARSG
ncbi:MAG: hypothetical protein K0Q72_1807, partial [Armatimonadetes bacterium]|nr:hypothetical protein [Armatimonadota bacterium]